MEDTQWDTNATGFTWKDKILDYEIETKLVNMAQRLSKQRLKR